MMLLSSTILLLVSSVSAIPAHPFASVLTHSSSAAAKLPMGKTPISRSDMKEIARLAATVNQAYCPLDSTPQASNHLQPVRHQRRQHVQHDLHVVTSSIDPEFAHLADELDMSWYISHTPATSTLTLAFSSLSSVDDLLEVLAADPVGEALVDLPDYLFPAETLPFPAPRMHHSHVDALETHGTSALLALLDLLETPPMTPGALLGKFLGKDNSIKNVEIVGHGLGASTAMLVSLALDLELSGPAAAAYEKPLPKVNIATTLFSLPRVGDQHYADWVDSVVSDRSNFTMHRITSYADTISHLPERHLDLAHPSIGEIWIGADPRTAYACVAEGESPECSASIPLPKTSLADHSGPFAGVWIGKGTCRRLKKVQMTVSDGEMVVM